MHVAGFTPARSAAPSPSLHQTAPRSCESQASQESPGRRGFAVPSRPADGADTSEPPNASPIPHHRSGFNRLAAYDIPCSVPALANANDPDMDDQPKTRLICRRCAARRKLARQLPWLDHRLPRGSAVSVHRLRACRHGRVARVRGRRGAVKRGNATGSNYSSPSGAQFNPRQARDRISQWTTPARRANPPSDG